MTGLNPGRQRRDTLPSSELEADSSLGSVACRRQRRCGLCERARSLEPDIPSASAGQGFRAFEPPPPRCSFIHQYRIPTAYHHNLVRQLNNPKFDHDSARSLSPLLRPNPGLPKSRSTRLEGTGQLPKLHGCYSDYYRDGRFRAPPGSTPIMQAVSPTPCELHVMVGAVVA